MPMPTTKSSSSPMSSMSSLLPRRRPLPASALPAPPARLLPLFLSLIVLLPLLRAPSAHAQEAEGFKCSIPTAGCKNGMFSEKKCECECIPPYCLFDYDQTCTLPSGNCDAPWTDCEKGVDCPWWVNPLMDESCTTGPKVPPDLWVIYNTRKACCDTNFLYSEICNVAPEMPEVPTKHPTIVLEETPFEIIPLKFDLMGVPDDVRVRDLKEEMTVVLKRILLRMAESIPGMIIKEVEERVVLPNSRRGLREMVRGLVGRGNRARGLAQAVSLYYNVKVVRVEGKKFGPLIINEMRDSYDDIVEQIQTFTDINYFGGDLIMNLCTTENGKFGQCLREVPPTPAPVPPTPMPVIPVPVPLQPVPAPVDVLVLTEPEAGGSGFPGWAIALIVICLLLLLCCVGYLCFVAFFPRNNDENKVQNNVFLDERSRGGRDFENESRRSRRSRGRSRYDEDSYDDPSILMIENARDERSRRTARDEELQIVLREPQAPAVAVDSSTVNTRGTKQRGEPRAPPSVHTVAEESYTVNTREPQRQGRDPTFYVPGQEDRPDPDSMTSNGDDAGRRYYVEDPPLRPKRDPTMYVPGGTDAPTRPPREPSFYAEGSLDPSMYPEGERDPSIYVEGGRDPTRYVEGERDPTRYEDDKGWYEDDGAGASRLDPYDNYGNYDDPSYMDYVSGLGSEAEEGSFQTEHPSTLESKKSKKSKKKSKKDKRNSHE